MKLELLNPPLPLRHDEGDTVRVGPTRVTLDSVIFAYNQGASAEEIVREQFTSLDLADVHATLAFYLRNRQVIDEYLRGRELEAAELQREIESKIDTTALRQRLLNRAKRA